MSCCGHAEGLLRLLRPEEDGEESCSLGQGGDDNVSVGGDETEIETGRGIGLGTDCAAELIGMVGEQEEDTDDKEDDEDDADDNDIEDDLFSELSMTRSCISPPISPISYGRAQANFSVHFKKELPIYMVFLI